MPADLPVPTLAATAVHDIDSKIVGDGYRIFIARPPAGFTGRAPVLLALDGNSSFGLVTDTARLLAIDGQVPPVCVVGLGYPAQCFHETVARRTRDCTPTRSEPFESLMKLEEPASEPPITGGAPRFMRFIVEELLPWLRSEVADADCDDVTLLGSSFGGLFASFALIEAAPAFQRYVIGSPALWWDRGEILRRTIPSVHGRVFISCAGEETEARARQAMAASPVELRNAALRTGNSFGIREPTETFISALRARCSTALRLSAHVFADENHLSVIPGHISRGLRAVFVAD